MNVSTGFLILGILFSAVYITFRLYENKDYFSLLLLCLQVFSVTLAFLIFFTDVQSSILLQLTCLILGIFIPIYVFYIDIRRFFCTFEMQLNKALFKVIIRCIIRKNMDVSDYTKLNSLVAESYYKKVLVKNPTDIQTLFKLGAELEVIGNMDEAIAAYSTVIRLNSSNVEAYKRFGLLMYKRGNHHKAVEIFKHAINISPEDYQLYTYLGISLWEIKQFSEAAEVFKKALCIRPDVIDIKCYLAASLIEAGNQIDAYDVYEKMLGKYFDT